MREQTIDRKDDEGHQHEDRAQDQHVCQWRRGRWRNELRQKRKKENRQLGVEQIQQYCFNHQLPCTRLRGRLIKRKARAILPSGVGQIQQISDACILDAGEDHLHFLRDRGQAEGLLEEAVRVYARDHGGQCVL